MANAQSSPEKESFLLVLFRYGEVSSPSQARFTDLDLDFSGFDSTPAMKVEVPDNVGNFPEKECRVILPLGEVGSFAERISSGVPHAATWVQIEEVTQGLLPGDQGSQRIIFNGRVMRAKRNFQGRSNVVALLALPIKSRLNIPIGVPCNHHCAWNLFSRGCGLSRDSFSETGEIDSSDGQEVVVTTAAVTGESGTYWRRGYMTKDGLTIPIRDWSDTDPTVFQMARKVPDDWLLAGSASITFTPGCDKLIETCRSRYNNEEHFYGLGYGIPPYHPIIESPA